MRSAGPGSEAPSSCQICIWRILVALESEQRAPSYKVGYEIWLDLWVHGLKMARFGLMGKSWSDFPSYDTVAGISTIWL